MNYNIIIYKHFILNLGQKYSFVVAAEKMNTSINKMETFYIIYRELTLLL